jgi:ArsR family transcriptional regulator
LAALRKAALVTDRKEGLWIYYRINPEIPQWAEEVIQAAADGIKHEEPYIGDAIAMAKILDRPADICSA